MPTEAHLFFTAFAQLSFDRPIGMVVGPIPWSSVQRWGAAHGFDDADDLALLVRLIREMEDERAAAEAGKPADDKPTMTPELFRAMFGGEQSN